MSEILQFAVDRMLGRLCKWLRIFGFNSLYVSIHCGKEVEHFQMENRIVLTRNQKWRHIRGVFFILHDQPMEQLKEVIRGMNIDKGMIHPFRICIRCNHFLHKAPEHEVFGRISEYTHTNMDSFQMCPKCNRIYWSGSHPVRVAEHMALVFGYPIKGNLKEV